MRSQFTFYKSFDDVLEDLNDKQIAEYLRKMLDVQFLRVRIDDVYFEDKLLSVIWKSQKHSIKSSINGYLDSQKRIGCKDPYIGCYDDNYKPLKGGCQAPYEGGSQQGKGKEKEEGKGKEKEEYPLWLNVEVWNEWVIFRKEKKSTLQSSTIKKQWAFLEKHKYDHEDIINQSIQNGWTGLFEIKRDYKQKNKMKLPSEYIREHMEKNDFVDVEVLNGGN